MNNNESISALDDSVNSDNFLVNLLEFAGPLSPGSTSWMDYMAEAETEMFQPDNADLDISWIDDNVLEVQSHQLPPNPPLGFDTFVPPNSNMVSAAADAAATNLLPSPIQLEDFPTIPADLTHAILHPVSKSQGQVIHESGDGLPVTTSGVAPKQNRKRSCKTKNESSPAETTEKMDLKQPKLAQSNQKGSQPAKKPARRRNNNDRIAGLEAKIDQLIDQNTSIASQFADVGEKLVGAMADNEKLKAEVEILREKANMAERWMQTKPVVVMPPINAAGRDPNSSVEHCTVMGVLQPVSIHPHPPPPPPFPANPQGGGGGDDVRRPATTTTITATTSSSRSQIPRQAQPARRKRTAKPK
ncbi:hypothetical protein Tsubulata_048936 [Turnera subulata]|uniref:BZIP domain-containing protein n=1 Tax=Turnera subulata TaxID=218843 RepID=A0A9Q0FG18_9ROSI|nr:hypothetical protein Tsubulata_048936 [Turnera subulata]